MRYSFLLVAIPLLAGGVTSATANELFQAPDCVRAGEWVQANRDNLPTTLDGLSSLDPAVRRAAYLAVPRTVKIAIWDEQLTAYSNSGELTDDQVRFVRWVTSKLPLIIPEDDAKVLSSTTEALIAQVTEEATMVLTPELIKRMFFVLGSIESNGKWVLQDEQAKTCNCHIGAMVSNCGVGHVPTECLETYDHEGMQFYCAPLSFGCGAFFTQSCDGWCEQAL
jgi:hypothetical protein